MSRRTLGAGLGFLRRERLVQFVKFCLVGGSGVFVDMGMLFLLADPKCLGLNLTFSKVLAAETALINNFLWNELWTFRPTASASGSLCASGGGGGGEVATPRFAVSPSPRFSGIARRFLLFNAICGLGIGLAVLLLHLFHTWLGWNLYLSNLLAIILVTCWNFGMNAWLNWPTTRRCLGPASAAMTGYAQATGQHRLPNRLCLASAPNALGRRSGIHRPRQVAPEDFEEALEVLTPASPPGFRSGAAITALISSARNDFGAGRGPPLSGHAAGPPVSKGEDDGGAQSTTHEKQQQTKRVERS